MVTKLTMRTCSGETNKRQKTQLDLVAISRNKNEMCGYKGSEMYFDSMKTSGANDTFETCLDCKKDLRDCRLSRTELNDNDDFLFRFKYERTNTSLSFCEFVKIRLDEQQKEFVAELSGLNPLERELAKRARIDLLNSQITKEKYISIKKRIESAKNGRERRNFTKMLCQLENRILANKDVLTSLSPEKESLPVIETKRRCIVRKADKTSVYEKTLRKTITHNFSLNPKIKVIKSNKG